MIQKSPVDRAPTRKFRIYGKYFMPQSINIAKRGQYGTSSNYRPSGFRRRTTPARRSLNCSTQPESGALGQIRQSLWGRLRHRASRLTGSGASGRGEGLDLLVGGSITGGGCGLNGERG